MALIKDQYEQEVLRSQLEIQENTFKTIAQELHDNIGQMLSVVKLSLSILPIEEDHPAYPQLKNSQEVLNKAIFDLSALTKSLHTDRINDVGLAESMRFELALIKNTGLVDVQFGTEGVEFPLPEQKAIFLFRIFQEVVNNILKHARATQIKVFLSYNEGDTFAMIIEDNGIGFDVEAMRKSVSSAKGVGLKSLFNRAHMIGADIDIKSEPDKGTVVEVRLKPELIKTA